jgi:hypothetical protein
MADIEGALTRFIAHKKPFFRLSATGCLIGGVT